MIVDEKKESCCPVCDQVWGGTVDVPFKLRKSVKDKSKRNINDMISSMKRAREESIEVFEIMDCPADQDSVEENIYKDLWDSHRVDLFNQGKHYESLLMDAAELLALRGDDFTFQKLRKDLETMGRIKNV